VIDTAVAAAELPARALAGRRVSVTAVVVAILALATMSVLLAATGDHVEHPLPTALYYGEIVLVSLLAGLYWFLRRPGSRFGPLLALFGLTAWVVSWQSASWPRAPASCSPSTSSSRSRPGIW
jgi:peptidoglycan/LPS O-acetylase OafA/YrhL